MINLDQFLSYQNFYLVGIKGVAMTALAGCLIDAGKTVNGADVAEDFVTQPQLKTLQINPDLDFNHSLPPNTEFVIYSGAHGGRTNPLVEQAQQKNIPILSHAQAQAVLFNAQQGWAVCGANGKSTVSAMLAFILTHTHQSLSFSVGVGEIKGLSRTGAYHPGTQTIFIAEADEYAEDVTQINPQVGLTQARFSFLKPQLIVANNLSWDHPDVYRDLAHTQQIFAEFFLQLKPNGQLIANRDDDQLWPVVEEVIRKRPDIHVLSFGRHPTAHLRLIETQIQPQGGQSQSQLLWQPDPTSSNEPGKLALTLQIPGDYNVMNAMAALTACLANQESSQLKLESLLSSLKAFASTKRRYELLGEVDQVTYIDDYAHHPDEIEAVIKATKSWYPDRRLVVGFQSHTYTRTLNLFDEFVTSFAQADEVVMIDIFPSARESSALASQVSSDQLCEAITLQYPRLSATNVHTVPALAKWCQENLRPRDVFLSLGAGDIYHFWDYLTLIDT